MLNRLQNRLEYLFGDDFLVLKEIVVYEDYTHRGHFSVKGFPIIEIRTNPSFSCECQDADNCGNKNGRVCVYNRYDYLIEVNVTVWIHPVFDLVHGMFDPDEVVEFLKDYYSISNLDELDLPW